MVQFKRKRWRDEGRTGKEMEREGNLEGAIWEEGKGCEKRGG